MAQNIRTGGSSGSTTSPPGNPPPPPPPPGPGPGGSSGESNGPDQPFGDLIGRRTCPPGYSLAQDGMCYRNEDFKKKGLKKVPGGEN